MTDEQTIVDTELKEAEEKAKSQEAQDGPTEQNEMNAMKPEETPNDVTPEDE